LDRSLDPITPLLHDLRYESMLFDLLGLDLEYYPDEQEEQQKELSEVTTKTKKTDKTEKEAESDKDDQGKKKKKPKPTELKS
jgi:hypothetical protein